MTDREKAIVMAYTRICMLTGDKFQIYHKYVEDIMGRPVWTHEMAFDSIADEIRAKSKDDFIALCADESSSENPNKWIPVSERLPEDGEVVLFSTKTDRVFEGRYFADFADDTDFQWYAFRDETFVENNVVTAWMPLPQPYKAESEDKE